MPRKKKPAVKIIADVKVPEDFENISTEAFLDAVTEHERHSKPDMVQAWDTLLKLKGGSEGMGKFLHELSEECREHGGMVAVKAADLCVRFGQFATPKDSVFNDMGLLTDDDITRELDAMLAKNPELAGQVSIKQKQIEGLSAANELLKAKNLELRKDLSTANATVNIIKVKMREAQQPVETMKLEITMLRKKAKEDQEMIEKLTAERDAAWKDIRALTGEA